MIILDENILEGQRLLLEASNTSVHQIGLDVGTKGLKDEQIVVLLRRLRQPTFLTRDLGFCTPALRNQRYAISDRNEVFGETGNQQVHLHIDEVGAS